MTKWTLGQVGKTKPKQSQNKANSKPIQTQYKANTNPIQSQYKPNSKPIQTQFKAKTKPIQSQYKPNFREAQMNVYEFPAQDIIIDRSFNLFTRNPAKYLQMSGLTADVLGPINPIQSSKIAFFGRKKLKYSLRLDYKESVCAIIPNTFRAELFYKRKGTGRMDIYESQLSRSSVLNERIAREVFALLPEDGPVMVIVGRDGNYWLSDPAKFSRLNISESFLKGLCAKIDDGAEPVVSQINDIGVVAIQLATEETNCGYVIIALPQYSSESTLINIGLIEILLNQISLIAKLVEKNEQAYEFQTNQLKMYSYGDIASS